MSYVDEDLVTSAVLEMLRTNLGMQVYDHVAPESGREFPYGVLMRIPGGGWAGPPLDDPEADVTLTYQLDGVGDRRDVAEWAAGQLGRVMVERADGAFKYALPLPAGLTECGRMRTDVPGGTEPEGSPPNQVYTVPSRYEVTVTPS